eukprot:CAMPEP_0119125870 /NCGR_PEP_ID=MMETSP1310-20130426/4997_1 /TAXON_ID=464262 /ORGANISM="Genus nov. species nov., Strain RCC2339" /LENGTH=223 /DNA_ID=CAMNT_0007115983 /DNA_START=344 /DNA_END=1015 /DNA_ORIENTATION=+
MTTLTTKIHGPERAADLDHSIFKFLCELYSAHAAKEISYKDLLVADPCLREAFELLMRLYYYYDNNPRKLSLASGFRRVEELLTLAADLVTAVIETRLEWDDEETYRLRNIVREVGNADFLEKCWEDETVNDTLFDMYDAMQKYNAFHYYSRSTGKRSEPPPELKKKLEQLIQTRNRPRQNFVLHSGVTQSMPEIRDFPGERENRNGTPNGGKSLEDPMDETT